ncbi:MAG: transcriptional regulator [Microgenomates group bacterium GW2011_GWA1_Microgenomates_45_10]|nr:MAG: transcriptional regulator [Microgenomates group bacterium GW2011_GWA2_44_7]KKT77276.1 MAG: transcriptional regulator [Microgenomates group bacterium GW2011_GWB1_44_8]KKT87463.1 MAG: transcriptional regulator [Microgenomates group bacterium GW2011_GWA1_Microgenomates_45_10]
MSGHSKWATIRRQKESNDAKRGQQFTKLANAITVAVREGGGVTDPQSNFKLRLVIQKAKEINMPKDNIQRAVDRGRGAGSGISLEEVLYEGYGPFGVGILVEAVTDNKQRTAQVVKNIFDKSGGSLAGPGAVSFQFNKVGFIVVEKSDPIDDQILKIIDLVGADDVEEVEDGLEIYVSLSQLETARKTLAENGFVVRSAEPAQRPTTVIEVKDPAEAKRVMKILDDLENLDDVQKVWANMDIPKDVLTEVLA